MKLNRIVELGSKHAWKDSEVELDLSDEVKRDYSDSYESSDVHGMMLAIGGLFDELNNYRIKQKKKAVTRLDTDGNEVLELLSAGEPLADSVIKDLNKKLQDGKTLTGLPEGRFHIGHLRIAYRLAKVNGEATIENINQDHYTIRYVVIFK